MYRVSKDTWAVGIVQCSQGSASYKSFGVARDLTAERESRTEGERVRGDCFLKIICDKKRSPKLR